MLAAKELRLFDDEGVQVEVQLHTGFRAIHALRDGDVDFYVSTAEEPFFRIGTERSSWLR